MSFSFTSDTANSNVLISEVTFSKQLQAATGKIVRSAISVEALTSFIMDSPMRRLCQLSTLVS